MIPFDAASRTILAANVCLRTASKEDAVRKVNRRFAGALKRSEDVKNESQVAVFLRRYAKCKASELVCTGIENGTPSFERERWIRNNEVEGLQRSLVQLEVWVSEHIVLPDLRGRNIVQDHIHDGQRLSGVIHLLAVER
jgi:hypothetical protein